MTPRRTIDRPLLARGARYRWDELRQQHQLVFPEGILVLNATGAAIVRLCNGRPVKELLAALASEFPDAETAEDASGFLDRLARKGLVRDASDP
jgi:coenzyme PQQ biosynthesis protein PqqD